jgi:hypothetical protein
MKIKHFKEELEKSGVYKVYVKNNKEAYLSSGFFVLDFIEGKNQASLDFFNPSNKKIMSFKFENKITPNELKHIQENFVPKKIDIEAKIDIEQLKGILDDEMHNRGITKDIQKLIIILQKDEDKLVWHCTGLLSGLALLKAHVDDESKTVLLMEKSSLFDMIKPTWAGSPERMNPQEIMRGSKPLIVDENGEEEMPQIFQESSENNQKAKSKKKSKSAVKETKDKEKAEGNNEGFIG